MLPKLALEYRKSSSIDFNDPEFRRLNYLRYADDWIVGIRGSLQDSKLILKKISVFCESIGLTVSPTKTKITNIQKDKGLFLGVELSRSRIHKFTRVKSSSSFRRVSKGLRLTVSLPYILKKLTSAGFIKINKPQPRYL